MQAKQKAAVRERPEPSPTHTPPPIPSVAAPSRPRVVCRPHHAPLLLVWLAAAGGPAAGKSCAGELLAGTLLSPSSCSPHLPPKAPQHLTSRLLRFVGSWEVHGGAAHRPAHGTDQRGLDPSRALPIAARTPVWSPLAAGRLCPDPCWIYPLRIARRRKGARASALELPPYTAHPGSAPQHSNSPCIQCSRAHASCAVGGAQRLPPSRKAAPLPAWAQRAPSWAWVLSSLGACVQDPGHAITHACWSSRSVSDTHLHASSWLLPSSIWLQGTSA